MTWFIISVYFCVFLIVTHEFTAEDSEAQSFYRLLRLRRSNRKKVFSAYSASSAVNHISKLN